jgi:hypothetical protein
MHSRTAYALAAAALGFATPAFGQSFVGAWTATAHLDGGQQSQETLSVTKADMGYLITGKAVNPQPGAPEAGPGTDVMIDGDKFSYKRSLSLNGNTIEIVYTGTVSGDSFTGTAELFGTKIPYTGVRIPAGK